MITVGNTTVNISIALDNSELGLLFPDSVGVQLRMMGEVQACEAGIAARIDTLATNLAAEAGGNILNDQQQVLLLPGPISTLLERYIEADSDDEQDGLANEIVTALLKGERVSA